MSTTAVTIPRRIGHRPLWLMALGVFVVLVGLGAFMWHLGRPSHPGFIEYRVLVKTDIPTVLAVAPDGAVWFTIEFSDAIGVFRNGRIERLAKGTENLEPLGLAVDAAGGAWYTDATKRAISRISPDGRIQSFPLSTPVVRLGRWPWPPMARCGSPISR